MIFSQTTKLKRLRKWMGTLCLYGVSSPTRIFLTSDGKPSFASSFIGCPTERFSAYTFPATMTQHDRTRLKCQEQCSGLVSIRTRVLNEIHLAPNIFYQG